MKRAILLLLILANFGLLAWHRWYSMPEAASVTLAPPLTGKPLQLASELGPAARKALATVAPSAATASTTAPAPAASTSALAAAGNACASYGPFSSDDVVQQAAGRLKPLGLQTSEHLVPGKAKQGYWVYLPPFSSRHEADAAEALLKKRGVADIYVVTDEANRNAISLGVFTLRTGATERQKQMKKLGFHALESERFRDEPRYWLDARGLAGALPAATVFNDLAEEGSPIGKATALCAG